MRLGILGGTFNPIHLGHIVLAKEVLKKLKLDKIIFVPTKITPLRNKEEIIAEEGRYQMLDLALKEYKEFEVSRIEIDRDGVSYSIDTIKALKDKIKKDTDLFFIVGSDVLDELDKWKDFDELCELTTFVIAKRPSFLVANMKERVTVINIEALDISSSEIRKMIKESKDCSKLLPHKVYGYIIEKGLYK